MATRNKKIYKKKKDGSLELVGYLPTDDVSSRVDNVESSLKDNYLTKTEANNSFAGSAATQGALDGLNEATSNNATAINEIKSTLAGMNSFDYVVTSLPLPEASADTMYKIYLIKDDHTDSGDTFDEYITVEPTSGTYQWEKIGNTDLDLTPYAKTDDVMNNYVGNSTFEQYKDDLQHETSGLASRVTANESSINNLNNAVADRYTKAESDLAYVHSGALPYSEINTSYVGSVEGGTGSSPYGNKWDALIRIEHRNGGPADGHYYKTEIITNLIDHGDLFWRKTVADPNAWGEWKTLIDSSNLDSFLTKKRLTSDLGFGTYQPNIYWGSMTSGYAPLWGCDNPYGGGFHFAEKDGQTSMQINGTFRQREGLYEVIDTSTIGSQHVAEADTFTYGRGVFLNANSVNENTSWVKAVFGDESDRHFHIAEVRTQDTAPQHLLNNYSSGIAWKGADTYGALTVNYSGPNAYLCGGNGTSPVWGRNIVLSENGSNIADQSVAYADRAGYASSSNTATICESTALLTAEGTNLGAKIRSQYTTGTLGGGVTYHQATWYVVGNDGDTYNFSKMITTDNFGTNLTEALKNTQVEHTIRSDYATFLDNGNNDSTSISISYDNDNVTSLKYTSYPKLKINYVTGYGVLEGNVYNHGSFQLAVSGKSNGTIFIRSVEKGGREPSWVKLLTENDIADSLGTTDSKKVLSARQGSVLSGKIADNKNNIASLKTDVVRTRNMLSDYQPKLNNTIGATMQWLSFKKGSSYSISGIWCRSVTLTLNGSVGSNASSNFTIDSNYQSSYSNGDWYICVSPISGGYVDTMAYGVEYLDKTAYGGKIWARRVYSGTNTTYSFNIIAIRFY